MYIDIYAVHLQEHEQALAAMKKSLEEETQQALDAQEQQISQLIGQLEVGQARRKNILQKQDKLISELENQLSNKVSLYVYVNLATLIGQVIAKFWKQIYFCFMY